MSAPGQTQRKPRPHFPWAAGLALAGGGILGLLLVGFGLGLPIDTPASGLHPATVTSLFGLHPTATPFLPLHNTATPPQPLQPVEDLKVEAATFRSGLPEDLNIQDGGEWIDLWIQSGNGNFYNGHPLNVGFYPGSGCNFGDRRACSSLHDQGRVLLFTIHSGVGGEAQALRSAIEGTGLNRAGFSLAETAQQLENMIGAEVVIQQGGWTGRDYQIEAAVRIPPEDLATYFSLPFMDAVDWAAQSDPRLDQLVQGEGAVLFIETCGWRMAGEAWAPLVNDTTGSIYLIGIKVP